MNEIDLFEDEDDEEDEAEEASKDDLTLAEFNMNPMYARGFLKRNPDKKFIYRGKPTNDFFEYYLACCDDEEFNMLLEHASKFSKTQREMIDKVGKVKEIKQDLVEETIIKKDDKKSTISDYIDRNQELIKIISNLEEEILTLKMEKQKALDMLTFLYNLMSKKCEFVMFDEVENEYILQQLTDKEINIIEAIKEVIK